MRKFRLYFFASLTLAIFLSGCSGSSVRLELPDSHPAHPQATDPLFQPPPNYFEGRLLGEPSQTGDIMKMQQAPAHGHKMESHSGHGKDAESMESHPGYSPDKQSGDTHMEHGK